MKLSAAENAAKHLRREILGLPEGTHLGLEEGLSERLGISRPTLRQTARMLIQEQLLTVRRGMKGGYYTSRPDAKTVSQLATTFLVLARADLLDLLATSHALFREAMRSASLNTDEAARVIGPHRVVRFDCYGARRDRIGIYSRTRCFFSRASTVC